MRLRPNWAPSIVPQGLDQNVYLVVDDLGRLGRVGGKPMSREQTWTGIVNLLDGQYCDPVYVVAFNTAEKWSKDVSADVARNCARAVTCSSARRRPASKTM